MERLRDIDGETEKQRHGEIERYRRERQRNRDMERLRDIDGETEKQRHGEIERYRRRDRETETWRD